MAPRIEPFTAFSHLIDARLLSALSSLGFERPTLVQSKAIPLALDGRDIACRARTGSGKTLAYGIPVVQGILKVKEGLDRTDAKLHATRCLILVPTRELAEQVTSHVRCLTQDLGEDTMRIYNMAAGQRSGKGKANAKDKIQRYVFVLRRSGEGGSGRVLSRPVDVTDVFHPGHRLRMQLADLPDIVVSTPSRVLTHLRSEALSLTSLEFLVIDEADLILSYGHSAEDIQSILYGPWGIPNIYQSFLMSATMTLEVEELKGIVLRKPVGRLPPLFNAPLNSWSHILGHS
jgi:ATP-dependent RNA helicase DDX56/DBP9